MKKLLLLLFLSLSLFAKQGSVAVAIPPLQYAAEKIIHGKIKITSLFNENYFKFTPSRKSIRSIAGMSVYFTLQLPKEQAILKKFKEINPELNIVDLTKNLALIKDENGVANPYIWMDPVLYRKVVEIMYKNIVAVDEINEDFYKDNYKNLLEEIDNSFLTIKNKMYSTTEENFYVYGDYWDYFAKRYNINFYKQKKRILNAKEIPLIIEFTKEHYIQKTLVSALDNTYYAQSFSHKTNTKIIRHNVFAKNWDANLFLLAKNLVK